jgi:hypothetical protein
VAEKAGVKLALHPDDPPIPPLRGIGRVLTSASNLRIMNTMESGVSSTTPLITQSLLRNAYRPGGVFLRLCEMTSEGELGRSPPPRLNAPTTQLWKLDRPTTFAAGSS